MKTSIKVTTAVCAAVVSMGVIGCGGGSSTPAADDPVVPSYAQKVTMDVPTAKKALNLIYGTPDIYMGFSGASAQMQSSSMEPAKSKLTFIPLALVNMLNDFTEEYAGGAVKLSRDTESDEANITIDCAYSGTVTIDEKYEYTELHGLDKYIYFKKYTFNECVHSAPIELIFDPYTTEEGYRFSYNGALSFQLDYTGLDSSDVEVASIVADGFHFTATEDGKKEREFTANFSGSFSNYEEDISNFYKFDVAVNGDIDMAEYNTTSGEKTASFVVKAIDFNYKGDRNEATRYASMLLDGYAYVAPDMNESHAGYLYGEDFTAAFQGDTDDDDIWSMDVNGGLGTACLGGTVEFDTVASWEINESMPDYDGDFSYPQTPYAGKMTIAGAENKAELTFGKTEDPKAWAQIGMEGEVPEPKTTIVKIMDENCTVFPSGG